MLSATWVQRLVVEVDLEQDLALYSKLYFLDWVLIAFFVAMYVAALVNRRNVAIHQRCIMLTLVPLMPPALGRAYAFYALFPLGFEFADMFHPMMLTTTLVLVMAVVDDRRRGAVLWPYPTALAVFVLAYVVSLAAPESESILAFLRWTAV